MSKQPSSWDEALVAAGFTDPRNGRPSVNQLAIAAEIPQSTIAAAVAGRRVPKPETVERIASALGVDVRVVSGWVGQRRTERAPYKPPQEADLLTDRQRRAVDEIIRAIVAERASSNDNQPTTQTPHPPRPNGTTSRPDERRQAFREAEAQELKAWEARQRRKATQ